MCVETKKARGSPGPGVAGSCKPPDVGAGTQNQILFKNSDPSSIVSHLSSPPHWCVHCFEGPSCEHSSVRSL